MNSPSAPPPNYGAAVNSSYSEPGIASGQTAPQEPPPKYEPPKQDAYQHPYPAQQYGTTTVQQTVIIRQPGYGADPVTTECPNCRAVVTTQTQYKTGAITWLSAGLICLFGCWMGCCLIPFCINDLQDVEHRCPNCGTHLSTYSRI